MSKKSSSSTAQEAKPLRDRNLEAFERYQPDIHGRLLDHVPISRLEVDEDGVADTVFNDQYFYNKKNEQYVTDQLNACLLYTSPSPRDGLLSRMPSSA